MSKIGEDIIPETKKDFSNGWRLLKENYKAFLGTELFAIFSSVFFSFLTFIIIIVFFIVNPALDISNFRQFWMDNFNESHGFRLIILSIGQTIFMIFLNCQYGLAYDIMSSGDMFAEFKGSFVYFKRHWWQYIILDLFIFNLPALLFSFGRFAQNIPNIETWLLIILQIVMLIVNFFVFVAFSNVLPSLVSQGSLKNSLIENFRILKNNCKRLLSTWGMFYCLLLIPPQFMLFIIMQFYMVITPWVSISIIIFIAIYMLFIIYPLITLISMGIYNNAEFERINESKND